MKIIQIIFALGALVISNARAADFTNTLLPLPQSVKMEPGSLELTRDTSVSLDNESESAGRYFAERLRQGTGWPVPVTSSGTIRFQVVANAKVSPEAYTLQITPAGVIVRANSSAGIARGAERLLQLMPPTVYGSNQCATLTQPAVTITDAPHFAWRGLMLDVSRKFQDKDTILKLLDGMAASKLNVFHWHLTDDQGWRLPIEGYPNLTEKGPAYSRADIQAVVERAGALGITILPEIDMPGHSGASCRAYPAISILNGKGQPTGTMNPGADATYAFIEAVLKDVSAQFPASPCVHIGADEVGGGWDNDWQCKALMQREHLKNAHEVYVYFVNRVVAIARSDGKRCVAWDEAFDAKNDPSLIIMSWHGMEPGINAIKAGRDVVFCPDPQLYFDHANSRSKNNPVAFSGHTSYLNSVYFLNPDVPAIPVSDRGHVLGAEGCLWGERVRDAGHMFTMMFPRSVALGETLWMPRERLDWPGFLTRLAVQRRRFDAMGIPYFWEPDSVAVNIGSWKAGDVTAKQGVLEFELGGSLHNAGVEEIFVAQGAGEGQFRIDAVELLKNGVVVDQDRHPYESSIYKDARSLYLVKNADLAGHYSVRIHVKQLFGDCGAIVQLIPALAADQYSSQCGPDTGANRTKQNAVP